MRDFTDFESQVEMTRLLTEFFAPMGGHRRFIVITVAEAENGVVPSMNLFPIGWTPSPAVIHYIIHQLSHSEPDSVMMINAAPETPGE